jgi:hypothetical protein
VCVAGLGLGLELDGLNRATTSSAMVTERAGASQKEPAVDAYGGRCFAFSFFPCWFDFGRDNKQNARKWHENPATCM